MNYADKVTALITTSVIPSHPSTAVIAQAYENIQSHLSGIPIIICADGLHDSLQSWRPQYDEYKKNLRALNWPNTEIIEFSEYNHQYQMARHVFKNNKITTPLVLWNEHDWMILPNIDWDKIMQTLLVDHEVAHMRFAENNGADPTSNVIDPKFDRGPVTTKSGLNLLRTTEYFSCPNIARREFFEAVIGMADWGHIYFECVARGFAEKDNGRQFPLSYYNPQPNRKRSQHLDGRIADGPPELVATGMKMPPMDVDPNFHVRCNYNDAGMLINPEPKYYQ